MPSKASKSLIVGLGHPRCGTGFTASLLQSAGLDVGHEKMGADGIVSWMAVAEREIVPYGSGIDKLRGHKAFCAVRSPLAAIPSIIPENGRPRSLAWRAQVIWEKRKVDICSRPFVPPNNIALAVASYVHWFELCLERKPKVIFRIDREEDDARLGEFVGRDLRRTPDLRTNARPRVRFQGFKPQMIARAGSELVTRFADLADRLGYPEDAATIRAQLDKAARGAGATTAESPGPAKPAPSRRKPADKGKTLTA